MRCQLIPISFDDQERLQAVDTAPFLRLVRLKPLSYRNALTEVGLNKKKTGKAGKIAAAGLYTL